MSTNNSLSIVVLRCLQALITVGFLASSAMAVHLFVAPGGNDLNDCLSHPTACKTIQAAVNKASNGDFIAISAGTYAGTISIVDRANLTISGAGSLTMIVPPAGPLPSSQPLIEIVDSRRIAFHGVTVSGAGSDTEGFRIFYSTSVSINDCVVEGHQGVGGGIFVNGSRGIFVNASVLQDNGLGLRVDGNSQAALSSPPFAAANSIVRRNGIGVQVRSGEFEFQGSGIIEENGNGILVDGGMVKACCENQSAPRKVNGNIVGILIRTGASVELRGPMEFIGNQNFAIRQFGSGTTITGKMLFQSNGSAATSALNIAGGHMLIQGGAAPNNVVIKDNPGIGIFMSDAASLRMTNVTVTNNQVHGLRLQALAIAVLAGGIFMNNNSGRDLSCAPNSFARGDNTGVNTQFCPGFDSTLPDPHGP